MLRKIILLVLLLLLTLPVQAQESTPQGEASVDSQFVGRPDLPAP